MSLFLLFVTAVGLSMDAFAVAICKGMANKQIGIKGALIVGAYFGFFQALMPLLGYLAGAQFSGAIESYDHWIAFILLGIIGGKMIKEALEPCPEDAGDASLSFKAMLPLAIATSIDALASGVTFAVMKVNIYHAITFIGCTTFILSALGVFVGKLFGLKFKAKAELAGGAALILIGLKILLDHLGVLSF